MSSRLQARIGTLRQLEIFQAVYTCASVTAAAERLHLTQPTVSMQLKKLSAALGDPLYNQLGRKLVFTEAGHRLAQTAREVLDSFTRLETDLADLQGLQAGTLKLAVVSTSKYFIPHLLGPFYRLYPGVDFRLQVGNRQQIIQRLQQGEDDFYLFSHIPEEADIESVEFLPNPLVAIAAQDHPLSRQPSIKLQDICSEPFLMRESGSGTRHAIDQFLKARQLTLNTRMTIESNEAIKHSVMAGLGISILSQHTLSFGGGSGLCTLPISELPIMSHWHIVWPRGKQLSRLARRFLDYLNEEGRQALINELKAERWPWTQAAGSPE